MLSKITRYGNIFPNLYIDAKYRVGDNCVYYEFDTSRIGRVVINKPNVITEYRGSKIFVKYPNIHLSAESIGGNLSAIVNLLDILGEFVDVNIHLPNYSIFYALVAYTGNKSRAVNAARSYIKRRECAVAYTLPIRGMGKEDFDEYRD